MITRSRFRSRATSSANSRQSETPRRCSRTSVFPALRCESRRRQSIASHFLNHTNKPHSDRPASSRTRRRSRSARPPSCLGLGRLCRYAAHRACDHADDARPPRRARSIRNPKSTNSTAHLLPSTLCRRLGLGCRAPSPAMIPSACRISSTAPGSSSTPEISS